MATQHAVVFGSTGRVGSAVVRIALERGHRVTAVARDPAKVEQRAAGLTVIRGDTSDPQSVAAVLTAAADATAVIMAVGSDPLKASTLVTTTVRNIAQAMPAAGVRRYLGVSGTAQMPATILGRMTQLGLRLAIKATADHQHAYHVITDTDLDYVLAGCPYIKDGAAASRYQEHPGKFPGGYKTITPTNVADFLCTELDRERYHRQIVGIW